MTTSEFGVTILQSKFIRISLTWLLTRYLETTKHSHPLNFLSFFRWWPEVPVILAIFAATCIMGNLSHHVYKNEKRTSRYTNNGCRLSSMVFKQSCWFIIAFYITWVQYLALQVCEARSALHSVAHIMTNQKSHLNHFSCFLNLVYVVFWQRIWQLRPHS